MYSRVCFSVSLKTTDVFSCVYFLKLCFPLPPPPTSGDHQSALCVRLSEGRRQKLKGTSVLFLTSWLWRTPSEPPTPFSISIHFLGYPDQSPGFDNIRVLTAPWNPDPRKSSRYFRLNISKLEIWFPPLRPHQLLPQCSPFRKQDHQSSALSLPVLQPESEVPGSRHGNNLSVQWQING